MEYNKEKLDNKDVLLKYQNYFLAFFIIVSILLAYTYRFIQDDAFISFIYSRNLVEGKGLTWFGERVEGYTNFLWVIILTPVFLFKADPVFWSQIIGIILYGFTVYFFWKIAIFLFEKVIPAFIASALLITNYSMISYATGGLETILNLFLITFTFYVYLKMISGDENNYRKSLSIISILSALSLLTRLDSLIPILIFYFFIFIWLHNKNEKWADLLYLILPLLIIIGIWFSWKLYYYGSILPNSYFVKIDSFKLLHKNGIKYIYRFFHWYMLWPFILVGIILSFSMKIKIKKNFVPIILFLICWVFYVYFADGDFMEFRFFVLIIPFLFLLISHFIYYVIAEFLSPIKYVTIFMSLTVLILFSYLHSVNFTSLSEDNYLDSINALSNFYGYYSEKNWDKIGAVLKKEFEGKNVKLAAGPVGAIVYYSEMKTIDMLGLNTKNIEENYILKNVNYNRPGHKLISKINYLINEKVNFIIAHPLVLNKGELSATDAGDRMKKWLFLNLGQTVFPFRELSFVGLPLNEKEILVMPYLTKTDDINKLIIEKKYEFTNVKL